MDSNSRFIRKGRGGELAYVTTHCQHPMCGTNGSQRIHKYYACHMPAPGEYTNDCYGSPGVGVVGAAQRPGVSARGLVPSHKRGGRMASFRQKTAGFSRNEAAWHRRCKDAYMLCASCLVANASEQQRFRSFRFCRYPVTEIRGYSMLSYIIPIWSTSRPKQRIGTRVPASFSGICGVSRRERAACHSRRIL